MAAALALDVLGGLLVIGAQFWSLPLLWSLPLGFVSAIIYRSLARAKGRQTLGQAVFHLLTVSREAGPAGYLESARRTVGEVALLPVALLGRPKALADIDQFSGCYEVRLV
jgi:hypothetical protein